ncbi:MAG: hypothetical protein NTW86_28305, partial [Candidatus Sumerlaeota bacterium]|nr:hypothetical protein [Candidatus Sumerlaeota bacterium]
MPPTPRETLLDGEWQIVFDPENKGRRENWQALPEPPSGARPIRVPSVWEEINPNYDGVAWYWKRVQFPPTPPNGRTTLRFDAVNYFSEVWIDGRFVGGKEGGYTPFEFFVTEFVRGGGEHTLVVRVLCPPKDGELDGFVLKATPCWRQEESFNFGGIWQSVRLFNYPAVNIGDCRVQPTAELNGVDVTGLLLNRIGASEAKIRFALCLWPQPDCPLLERVESFQGLSKLHTIPVYTHLSIENPQLWSPDSPNLYLLKIQSSARLGREWIEDNIQVRFGLRWLTLKNLRFHLNGEPIFLKGGFHEGLYPMGLVIPPSREFVEDEIAKAKRAGFNLLRFWQIPIHPLVLDVADEMGMMLCEEPPIEWILQTEKTYELCEEEIRRMVLRDRNRPSVVMWTVLNEGGSLDKPRPGRVITAIENLPGTVVQRKLERFCQEAIRRFDLTRLIIDESGAWGKPAYAYLPSSNERVVINDIHRYIPGPTSDAALAPLRAFGQETGVFGRGHVVAGRPVFVSEFGYGSFPDLPKLVSQYEEHGGQGREDYEALKTLLGSFEEGFRARRMDRFFSGIGEIIEETQRIHAESDYLQALAIRSNPRATGYVMHAFSAGGCILGAEAFDMWRNEKAVARAIAEANQPHVLAVFLSDTATDGGAPMLAEVFSINEDGPAWGLTLTLTIRDAPGGKSKSK